MEKEETVEDFLMDETSSIESSTNSGPNLVLLHDQLLLVETNYVQQCSSGSSPASVDSSPLIQPSAIETVDRNKESLKLKLLSRRPMSTLVEQGILPPLKTPAAYSGQRVKLERARMSDLLKAKIQQRPGRQELIRQHILEDTNSRVAPSLAEAQRMLKRARLADSLNDHLIHRPGPLELVKKNILHAPSPEVENAIKEGVVEFRATSEGHIPGPHGVGHMIHGPEELTATSSSSSKGIVEVELSEDDSSSSDLSSPSPPSQQQPLLPPPPPPPQIQQPLTTTPQPQQAQQEQATVPQQQPARVTSYTSKPHVCKSRSSKKSSSKSNNKSNNSNQQQQQQQQQTSTNSSSSTQQQKTRQIKFHEYKGPPSAKSCNTSNSNIPSTNQESCNVDNTSTDSSTTSYDLLLQQQQLFLQWQLECRHKYPQLILPAGVGPSQSSSSISSLSSQQTQQQGQQGQQQSQLRLLSPSNLLTATLLSSSTSSPRPALILPKLDQSSSTNNPVITVSSLVEKYNRNSNGVIPVPTSMIPIKPKPVSATTVNLAKIETLKSSNLDQSTTTTTVLVSTTKSVDESNNNYKEMKVSDLRAECKRRNLPVSGPKPTLLERLRSNTNNLQDEIVSSSSNKPEVKQQNTTTRVEEGMLRSQEAQILQLQQALNNSQEQLLRMKNGNTTPVPSPVLSSPPVVSIAPGQTHRLALQQHIHHKMEQQKIQAQIAQLIQTSESTENSTVNKVKPGKLKSTLSKVKGGRDNNNTITLHKSSEEEVSATSNTRSDMDEHAWLLKINPEPLLNSSHLNNQLCTRKGVVLEYKSFFENYPNQPSPNSTPHHQLMSSDLVVHSSSASTGSEVRADTDIIGLVKSQMVDDVLEILIRNGELPPSAAHDPDQLCTRIIGSIPPPPPPPLPPPSFSVTLPTSISFSRPSSSTLQSSQEAADILKISQDLSNFGQDENKLFKFTDSHLLKLDNHHHLDMIHQDIDMIEESLNTYTNHQLGNHALVHRNGSNLALHGNGSLSNIALHGNGSLSNEHMNDSLNGIHSNDSLNGIHSNDSLNGIHSNDRTQIHGNDSLTNQHLSNHEDGQMMMDEGELEVSGLMDRSLEDEMPMEMDYSDWLDNLLPPPSTTGARGNNNSSSSYCSNIDYGGLLLLADDGENDYDPLLSSRSGFQALLSQQDITNSSTASSSNNMTHDMSMKRSSSPANSSSLHSNHELSTCNNTENIWDFI